MKKSIEVKTKFAGRVWVHERYIKMIEDGGTLTIKHDGKEMTVNQSVLDDTPPQKGKESYVERYGADKGKRYYLYGFFFVADGAEVVKKKEVQEEAKKAGLLAQCPRCLAVKVRLYQNKKEKVAWQQSIAEFTHIEKEVCPSCRAKDGTLK